MVPVIVYRKEEGNPILCIMAMLAKAKEVLRQDVSPIPVQRRQRKLA